jgi:MFS family permease
MTGEERTPASSWVALVILSMAAWYAVIDKQVLILLAQPLRTDLGLSDTQIGGLQGAGAALFTAIAVVPLGWVSDRIDRRIVLAACVLVWSVAAAACAWATGYWSLLACVAFLAAGEAGLTPTVSAIVPDLVPERQRMTANFVLFGTVRVGEKIVEVAGQMCARSSERDRFDHDTVFGASQPTQRRTDLDLPDAHVEMTPP